MTSQPSELRELHDDELETRLREAKEELFNSAVPDGDRAAGQQPATAHRAARHRADLHDPARAGARPVGGTGRTRGIGVSEHRSERQRARSAAMPAMSARAKSKGTSA